MRVKWKRNFGEVQTAGFDVYHDPKMGKGLWQWISTWVMARGIFEKRRRSLQNTIGLFKIFFKRDFPSERLLVSVQIKRENLQDQDQALAESK